jgi:hypothetical protein
LGFIDAVMPSTDDSNRPLLPDGQRQNRRVLRTGSPNLRTLQKKDRKKAESVFKAEDVRLLLKFK